MSDTSIETLKASLQSDDLSIRYLAAFELSKRDQSQGLDTLIDYVKHRHFRYLDCYEVVDHLAQYDDERVVEALVGMLDHTGHVVGNALAALLVSGTKQGVQAVIDKLKTPSPWLGWGTAQLFADHGGRYVPQLLQASFDTDPLMRARSIYALGGIGANHESVTIRERLIAALSDTDAVVCEKAVAGLMDIHSPDVFQVLVAVLDSENIPAAQLAAEGLYRAGTDKVKAIDVLIRSLKKDDWVIRRNAVWALRRIGAVEGVPALIDVAKHDPTRGLRHYAVEALAVIGDPRAIPVVRGGLSDSDEMVRASCVKALAKLVGADSAPEFIALRLDESALVEQAIAEAWHTFGYVPPH